MSQVIHALGLTELGAAVDQAVRAIPPLWPLSSSVAVNPFLGQSGESLATAAARLARTAGAPATMPRGWYRQKIAAGAIAREDLRQAWEAAPRALRPQGLAALDDAIAKDAPAPNALPSIAELASDASGIDWPGIIAERIGAWAAAYFDEGQALWAAPRGKSAFAAWRATAMHDLTPEIAGLKDFALHVFEYPDDSMAAIARATERLGIADAALETCFHRLLMTLGGWAQYARYKLWQAELRGGVDNTTIDLLAIRLVWEEALYLQYKSAIAERWAATLTAHAAPIVATPDTVIDEILQGAADRAAQRALAAELDTPAKPSADARPALQAVFCIDVRSEVFRRALESVSPEIKTLGFAGFFGLGTAHRRFGSDVEEARLPVLLNPSLRTCTAAPDDPADQAARVGSRARRAWGRFKLAAVSSFAFVEATGPVYAGKLLSDALRLNRKPAPSDPVPRLSPPLDVAQRIGSA